MVRGVDYLLDPPADPDGVRVGLTLPGVFAAAVRRTPEETAIDDEHGARTWRDWAAEVAAVAAGLQARDVTPGDVVAVQLPNRIDFETVHLAVSAIGGVLLPVHAGYGRADVVALLGRVDPVAVVQDEDSSPVSGTDLLDAITSLRVVVTVGDEAYVDPLDQPRAVVGLPALRARWSGCVPHPVDVVPDQPLVLVPSSGTTTARPKLCIHSHDGLLSSTATLVGDGFAGPVMIAGALTHLFGLQAMYSALLSGSGQALTGTWDVERFVSVARRIRPAVLFAVPPQLYDLVAHGGIRCPEVRTAGAVLPSALAGEIDAVLGATVVVVWGMSEIGYGTYTRPGDTAETSTASIGRPARGATVRVVDDDDEVCSPGVVGALQYRGPGMFRGYLGEPSLTAAALTADGFLRTGDMAVVDVGGLVGFRGRSQELINVGGQKFNRMEIEGLLATEPRLAALAIVGKPDARLGEYPCLVLTPAADLTMDLDAVTALLRRHGVAEYKIPLELLRVDELPMTPAGKLDRRELGEILDQAVAERALHGGPAAVLMSYDDALALVRTHTAELLRCEPDQVDAGVSFRSQGVNSLLAVRLGTMLSDAVGLPFPASLAFDFPTPDSVAQLLTEQPRPVSSSV